MTRRVWLVTEKAFGKTIGWRHFLTYAEARATADKWRLQNAGEISLEQVEVPI